MIAMVGVEQLHCVVGQTSVSEVVNTRSLALSMQATVPMPVRLAVPAKRLAKAPATWGAVSHCTNRPQTRPVEWMIRVGKGDHQEEWLVPVLDPIRAQIINRVLTDIGDGIKRLGDRGGQGLRTNIVMW